METEKRSRDSGLRLTRRNDILKKSVTIQRLLFRKVFWHEYAKIPRVACKNPIAKGDFYWIFARNCEGTEQLRKSL